ncbi:hypothetical protein BH09VER1_BH09VER1_26390 [soil metagenome]
MKHLTDINNPLTGIITPSSGREYMNGKPVLYRENTRSILNLTNDEFRLKRLCDGLTFTTGDGCLYSCSFCYTESTPISWQNKKLINALNVEMGLGFYDRDNSFQKKNPKTGKLGV